MSVYGYSYASYTLAVSVERGSSTAPVKVDSGLQQNVPLIKTLHNEFDTYTGFFKVQFDKDKEDESIDINIRHISKATRTFFKWNSPPDNSNY